MGTTYNGWPNRATWNVALWVGNDEPTYRAMQSVKAQQPRKRFTITTAREFAERVFPNGVTPDGCRLDEVTRDGWRDIAQAWNE